MPFLFSHVEYCDMHNVYGYCDGNASAAMNEYRRRYPERRIPSKRVFMRVEQALRDSGCLPDTGLTIVCICVTSDLHLPGINSLVSILSSSTEPSVK